MNRSSHRLTLRPLVFALPIWLVVAAPAAPGRQTAEEGQKPQPSSEQVLQRLEKMRDYAARRDAARVETLERYVQRLGEWLTEMRPKYDRLGTTQKEEFRRRIEEHKVLRDYHAALVVLTDKKSPAQHITQARRAARDLEAQYEEVAGKPMPSFLPPPQKKSR